jgi:hypothetical protein
LEKKTIKSWYFNPKKVKEMKVLKKNADKLNIVNVAKYFSGYKL